MLLTISNTDYTAALDADRPPRIVRRLNRPATLAATLVSTGTDFLVPAAGARLVLARADGYPLFTGYLDGVPAHEYLGWGERGPVYRYTLAATSDEVLLDRRTFAARAPFTGRTAGDILTQLAEALLPGAFNTDDVQDLLTISTFSTDPQLAWSEHAARLALRARACYRAHDGRLSLAPVGATVHTLSESGPSFTPDALQLASPDLLVNDVTVIGRVEPRAYVKDYFLGDGLSLGFYLSRSPWRRSTYSVLEEEYTGLQLVSDRWTLTDPAAAVSVSSGKLSLRGGTGADGGTRIVFNELLELGGALLLQHGEAEFVGPSNGVLGGLYSGDIVIGNCLAGFRVAPSGSQSAIQALISGVTTGALITTVAGHRYALTTRTYASEPFRTGEIFHSSAHPAGSGRGGATLSATLRVVLELRDIDPANPGSLAAPSTVLYDGVIPAAPAFVTYAPVNATNLQHDVTYTRIAELSEVEVRSQRPSESARTRLVGFFADGAECTVLDTPELRFFPEYVPDPNEAISVRYRGRARALVRLTDPASIAAHSGPGDDGVRGGLRRIVSPPARTAADCEQAALALLDDLTQPAWAGKYEVWSDFLPGDAFAVSVSSQAAGFTAIVRQVEVELRDPAGDRSFYSIAFANDAAEPLAFDFDPARILEPLEITATTATAGTTFAPDLPAAEITGITSTTVTIDAGADPISGGGFEVRHSDYGWGPENHRNLVGRYTTRVFTVPRLTRAQTFPLRQYDASSPPRYSRYSASLHIDYPL